MPNEEKFFEVGISRHAPKQEQKDETMDVRTQEVDMETAGEELETRTRALLENLEKAPEGTIMALEPSNVKRAGQTRDLFVQKLRELLQEGGDIELVTLGDSKEETAKALENIRLYPEKRFIIQDLRSTWLIGFNENDAQLPTLNTWKNRVKGDENYVGKIWSAHSDEIKKLNDELTNAGFDIKEEEIQPKEFLATPEEQALRQIQWMKGMKKIGSKHFPDRPLILEGISHNMRSDFAVLALLDEDISVESIDRVLGGRFRDPYERSNVIFFEDGSVEVTFRTSTKKYSKEEFEDIVKKIRNKNEARKKEWAA